MLRRSDASPPQRQQNEFLETSKLAEVKVAFRINFVSSLYIVCVESWLIPSHKIFVATTGRTPALQEQVACSRSHNLFTSSGIVSGISVRFKRFARASLPVLGRYWQDVPFLFVLHMILQVSDAHFYIAF